MPHSLPSPGRALACMAVMLSAAPFAAAQQGRDTPPHPPGQQKSAKTQALAVGAKVIQQNAPLTGFDIYLVGFHPMKDRPEEQMAAHHYCKQMNEDFAQCILFDGNTANANLTGIEYIISGKVFESLPAKERKYWHPHNGEILSGQLVAPGIPDIAEKSLMRSKMNSYGKTWHVWDTSRHDKSGNSLPLGPAMLAWSFNRDGEAIPAMVEKRDRELGVDTGEVRKKRQDLEPLAEPQEGVDAMKGEFARPTSDIPGVRDK